jgi:integrase
LKNVTKVDYQKALDKYGENHVKDTVSNFNSYVRLVVQEAMDEGIIYKDFTRKVEIDSQVKSNNRLKFLEENEAVKLRNYCLKSGGIFSITKFEIALAIATGFRYAEVVGLTWNDIDFTDNKISVNKTYNYKDHDGFKPTKTESSIRTIDVDSQTISMLKQLQLEQKKCFLRQGYKNKDNLVFINHKHTVPTNTAANKALQKALDTLKIKKRRTFHSLRHTHASMLIANNVSIEYIAERLGHSNTSTTAKTYIHLLQKRRESEVKKTINLFTNVN